MKNNSLPMIATVLAAAALLAALRPQKPPTPEPDPALAELARQMQSLEKKIERLDEGVVRLQIDKADAQLLEELRNAKPITAPAPEANGTPDLADFHAYLVELEERFSGVRMELVKGFEIKPTDYELAELKLTVNDPQASETDRIRALQILRRNDARTPEVIIAALQLYQQSDNARIQADVFRQLNGETHPAMRQPLLHAAANHASDNVREEAIETLGNFLPDQQIFNELVRIAEVDTDRGVKREALQQLERAQRRAEGR